MEHSEVYLKENKITFMGYLILLLVNKGDRNTETLFKRLPYDLKGSLTKAMQVMVNNGFLKMEGKEYYLTLKGVCLVADTAKPKRISKDALYDLFTFMYVRLGGKATLRMAHLTREILRDGSKPHLIRVTGSEGSRDFCAVARIVLDKKLASIRLNAFGSNVGLDLTDEGKEIAEKLESIWS